MGPRPTAGLHPRGKLGHTGAGKDAQWDKWKENWREKSTAKNPASHATLAEADSPAAPSLPRAPHPDSHSSDFWLLELSILKNKCLLF